MPTTAKVIISNARITLDQKISKVFKLYSRANESELDKNILNHS